MPLVTTALHFRRGLLVTSLQGLIRSILLGMGMDPAFITFFAHAAVGVAAALLVILLTGLSIPRRHEVRLRRAQH